MNLNKIAKRVFALQFPSQGIDRLIEINDAEDAGLNLDLKDKNLTDKLLINKLNLKLPKVAETVEAEGIKVEKIYEATDKLDGALYLGSRYWIQCLIWGGYIFRYSDGEENTTFGETASSIRELIPLIKSKLNGTNTRKKKKQQHPDFKDVNFGQDTDDNYRAR